ncbi:hypothetical protein [Streptomyces sp. NPDC048516]|uniref:hypothetical protein n=1 Tax=Streptomyces sp. NPDC048516 TaxID=3365565 RepID=UPI00371FE75A
MEIKPIGEVVAGRTDVADDYWGGIESVIQLDEAEFLHRARRPSPRSSTQQACLFTLRQPWQPTKPTDD